MALEQELATFRRELPRLLREGNQGRYALVQGETVEGIWLDRDQAIQAGYDRFDLAPFLVKEINDHEEPVYFSRSVKRCP